MATLEQNIRQAISDFDDIKAALEEKGVEVPYDTDTSTYGDLVRTLSSGEGEQEAYDKGYADGYENGEEEGWQDGWQEGFVAGESYGYHEGESDGYKRGHSEGFSEGETAGYNKGYVAGYDEGEEAGYGEGWSDGNTAGYDEALMIGLEEGKDNGIRAMWEAIQCYGQRTDYAYLLYGTSYTKKTFKPIYDIKLVGANGYNWMNSCYPQGSYCLIEEGQVNMKELEEEQGIVFDFSENTSFARTFASGLFSELNVIDISKGTSFSYAFYGGYINISYRDVLAPKRIERLICSETNQFQTTTFQYAVGYEYIGFEGVIASSINLSWSPLCPESMKKAILCLKNYAGTDKEFANTISFSDDCWAALESDSTAPNGMSWREYVGDLGWNA